MTRDELFLADMQNWLSEFFKSEFLKEHIQKLTMSETLECIDEYYEGGTLAFILK